LFRPTKGSEVTIFPILRIFSEILSDLGQRRACLLAEKVKLAEMREVCVQAGCRESKAKEGKLGIGRRVEVDPLIPFLSGIKSERF
jgi:hypothetical protein